MRPLLAAFLAIAVFLAGCMSEPRESSVSPSLSSQPSTSDIVVRIHDIEVRPISKVSLVLDNDSTTTSRIDGVAVFEDVPAGPHSLTASAPGFENLTKTFTSTNEILELRLTLEPLRDAYELNYYYAEIPCGGEVPCAGTSAGLDGLTTSPIGGFRNGTLRVEWKGGGDMAFAFEVANGGAPLPFPDHRYNLTFAGKSPLRFDVPASALSDPMRLGGVQYRIGILDAPPDMEATHVLAGFAVRSEPGPQPRFPELNETASGTLDFTSDAPTWAFTPTGPTGVIRIEGTLRHDCPLGTKVGPRVVYTDPTGETVVRELWPDDQADYVCGPAAAIPPFASTKELARLHLWDAAEWTATLSGECTCSLQLHVLEG